MQKKKYIQYWGYLIHKAARRIGGIMALIEPIEVVSLLVVTIALVYMLSAARQEKRWYPLTIGFIFLFLVNVFTIVECFAAEQLFNFLEHLSSAIAALIFAFACHRSFRRLSL
ncbi:MAG: hypothetical protein QMC77_06390 [Methanocellales archaeon]|nr:hypothetical protein [Methanocellales archaeon]